MHSNRFFHEKTPLVANRSRSENPALPVIDIYLNVLRAMLIEKKSPLDIEEIKILITLSETCHYFYKQICIANRSSPFQLNPITLLMNNISQHIENKERFNETVEINAQYLTSLIAELTIKLRKHLHRNTERTITTIPPENSDRWNINTIEKWYKAVYACSIFIGIALSTFAGKHSLFYVLANVFADEDSSNDRVTFKTTTDLWLFIGLTISIPILTALFLGLLINLLRPLEFITRQSVLLKSKYDLDKTVHYDPDALHEVKAQYAALTAPDRISIHKPTAMRLFYKVQSITPTQYKEAPLNQANRPRPIN